MLALGLNIFAPDTVVEENVCVVKITTYYYSTNRGLRIQKTIDILKKKCKGINVLTEDLSAIGAQEVAENIININEVRDGVYKVVTCNEHRDWETGDIDEYQYKLIPFTET